MRIARSLLMSTLLCSAVTAEAASLTPSLLARMSVDETYLLPSPGEPSSAIELKFAYSVAPGGLTDLSTVIFDGRLFDATSAGQSFTLTPFDATPDPELGAFLARLTNGVDDDIRDDAIGNNGGGIGRVAPESVRIAPLVAVFGPDLKGYTVSAVELFIAELFIDPSAGGAQPHWQVTGELRFLGSPSSVPLPQTALLLASAVGALAVRGIRRGGSHRS